jgi:hypothetical protein
MAIVPNGTKRTMMAQTFGRNPDMGLDNLSGLPDTGQQMSPNVPQTEPIDANQVQEQPVEQIQEQPAEQGEADEDLTSYVVSKLQEMGYPPRRLLEFEDKLVEEKIFPGEIREVNIVLPDSYYGKRLSGKDLAKIIKEVQEKFGLSFVDADRREKKVTMNFTSRRMETGNEAPVADALEEVYGSPASSGGNKKKTKAHTIQELLKMSKLLLYEDLKKFGDK